jgi:anthranilate phosphoribosyltransferase
VEKDIEQKGFGHLHAARYLHGVERLKPIRQTLFYRSFLHSCEVMMNPANASAMLIGAAHDTFLERFTKAPSGRGVQRVMVVQGLDGCDELPLRPTPAAEFKQGEVTTYTIDPKEYGLGEAKHHPCVSPEETARLIEAMLNGEDTSQREALIFNAGVRIYLGDKVESIEDGVELARETLASGKAGEKLVQLRG